MNSPRLQALSRLDTSTLLYRSLSSGLFMNLIAATCLVLGFAREEVQNAKLAWFAAIVLITVIRLIDLLRWNQQKELHGSRKHRLFCVGVVVNACLWSFYTLYFYRGADIYELSAMTIIVLMMASGASFSLCANRRAAIAYPIILIVPYSLLLISEGEQLQFISGFVGLAFCLTTVVNSQRAHQFTIDAIHFKNENKLLLEDMEQQVQQRTQKIYELSNLDPLTGLLNRSAFLVQLNDALVRKQSKVQNNFALLFLDLDHFKDINDNIGHRTGDQVLIEVAKRISDFCYDAKSICRWGGDEFLIAVPFRELWQLAEYAQQLIAMIGKPYPLNDGELNVSASVGIALYPQHGEEAEQLIQHADIAMYERKHSDPGGVTFYNDTLAEKLGREVWLRNKLARAIEHQELFLMYQPLISTKTGRPVSLEALLRWRVDGNLIPPDEFIPIAEQNGLIKSIGAWVLQQAFIASKKLNETHPGMIMGINVSLLQFQDEHFTQMISSLLHSVDAQPEYINLEITESAFSLEKHLLLTKIKQLQEMGFMVSIDDFGTGYSSLASILELTTNAIKIDKSFVDNLDTKGEIIIEAVIQIANRLGQHVVAEGVEYQWQADTLKQMGVHLIQGYLYAKPMTWPNLLQYLDEAHS
ncbi:EAL domain-containing protein [Shewanella avicenniae]|uniref:EAL domain-containing protein n=1 Tax=Shewanella avicenniae TaxID=2814294 RepID=A0ABX7QR11_9GAMM|nr:EAL domain-containing protein [Shewanella avicenniae]QSX33903.1 EAL domain-containing protein [Shewanella avicenniae]